MDREELVQAQVHHRLDSAAQLGHRHPVFHLSEDRQSRSQFHPEHREESGRRSIDVTPWSTATFFKSSWIDKIHWIILHIGIAIKRLRIRWVVSAIVWIGLRESHPLSRIPAHHCFIPAIRIALVSGVALGLERLVVTGSCLSTPRVEVNRT